MNFCQEAGLWLTFSNENLEKCSSVEKLKLREGDDRFVQPLKAESRQVHLEIDCHEKPFLFFFIVFFFIILISNAIIVTS